MSRNKQTFMSVSISSVKTNSHYRNLFYDFINISKRMYKKFKIKITQWFKPKISFHRFRKRRLQFCSLFGSKQVNTLQRLGIMANLKKCGFHAFVYTVAYIKTCKNIGFCEVLTTEFVLTTFKFNMCFCLLYIIG